MAVFPFFFLAIAMPIVMAARRRKRLLGMTRIVMSVVVVVLVVEHLVHGRGMRVMARSEMRRNMQQWRKDLQLDPPLSILSFLPFLLAPPPS